MINFLDRVNVGFAALAMNEDLGFSPSVFTGAAAGIALVNSMGNLGGLVGPALIGVLKQETGTFTAALPFLAGSLALAGVIALLFGYSAGMLCTSSRGEQTGRKPAD